MPSKRIFSFWIAGIAALLSVQCVAAACNPVPGLTTFYSDGWGIDLENHRLQRDTSMTRANVAQLELAWSYGYFTSKPRSWPLVTEDTIFIGDSGRGIVALDRATGCERWVHENRREISSAILPTRIGERTAFIFLDRLQGVFAIDATDGTLIWNARVDDEPVPDVFGHTDRPRRRRVCAAVVIGSGPRDHSALRLLHDERRHGGVRRADGQEALVPADDRGSRRIRPAGIGCSSKNTARAAPRSGVRRCSMRAAVSSISERVRTIVGRRAQRAMRSLH